MPRAHTYGLLSLASAWTYSALAAEPLPVTMDPTQTWVGEIVRQGGGWALAVYVIWIQNRDHRESSARRSATEERLFDQIGASTAALTEANATMTRMVEAYQRFPGGDP